MPRRILLIASSGTSLHLAPANDVPYGLSAYLFTEDMDRAIRVGERL